MARRCRPSRLPTPMTKASLSAASATATSKSPARTGIASRGRSSAPTARPTARRGQRLIASAPGGTWDSSDNGTYKINLNSTYGVKDVDGNYVTAQQLGTFNVNIVAKVALAAAETTT